MGDHALPDLSRRLKEELGRLSVEEKTRLKGIASSYARGTGQTANELLGEAVLRTARGTRRWGEFVPVGLHLTVTMRSIAFALRKKTRNNRECGGSANIQPLNGTVALVALSVEDHPDPRPSPEDALVMKDLREQIRWLLRDDKPALFIYDRVCLGYRGKELCADLTAGEIATILTRINRTLKRNSKLWS
jgi:hypothetical protein